MSESPHPQKAVIDLSEPTVAPVVDDVAARELAGKIDAMAPLSIAQFGQDVGAATATYTDSLLAHARGEDLDELGGKLGEIMIAAQSFDLGAFDNAWARAPVVGMVVRRFTVTKEKVMARFRTVEGQVDRLMGNVEGALKRLEERAATFDTMYTGVSQEHVLLATHVRAGEIKTAALDEEIKRLRARTPDLSTNELIGKLEASRNTLLKRIGDLATLQHSAMQTLPMIRMMQANNIVLLEKFQTIQRLTLPAWKRTFVIALALNEQREAVKLAGDIDDTTNYFLKRNSELLHENAVATAHASQRQVIDIETLRAVHDNVLKTLADVQNAYQDGAEKRGRAMAELARLREEMIQGVNRGGKKLPPRQRYG
jgi:uncharacterized protein YaaN involved in tellurite resistance